MNTRTRIDADGVATNHLVPIGTARALCGVTWFVRHDETQPAAPSCLRCSALAPVLASAPDMAASVTQVDEPAAD